MTGDAVSDQQAEVPAVPGVTRWRQKHPPEVEAMHWDGSVSGATAVIDWILANGSTARYHDGRAASGIGIPCVLSINTETGTTTAVPGDWVVMRRYGSFWPWTEETLTARYEPAGPPLTPEALQELRERFLEAVKGPSVFLPSDHWRDRAEAAEAKLAAITGQARSWAGSASANEWSGTLLSTTVLADAGRTILTIIGGEPAGSPLTPEGTQDSGVALIAAERARQVAAEGYTPEHDAGHPHGDLAGAAAAYALAATADPAAREFWPWDLASFKPGDAIRSLIKAGALVAAELDRLAAMEDGNG